MKKSLLIQLAIVGLLSLTAFADTEVETKKVEEKKEEVRKLSTIEEVDQEKKSLLIHDDFYVY